jgi:hypothetical protein
MQTESNINVAKCPGLGSVACVAVGACLIALILGDWFIAPQLAMFALLLWQTRRDIYAALPGFVIGYLIGVTLSSGIGAAAAIDCGLYGGTIIAPINAVCRGFWRAGVAMLLGTGAVIVAAQFILWILSMVGK